MVIDPRTVIVVLIAAIVVWHYLGFKVFLWAAICGILLIPITIIYIILRSEGKIKRFTTFFGKIRKEYLIIEKKFFKYLDRLF